MGSEIESPDILSSHQRINAVPAVRGHDLLLYHFSFAFQGKGHTLLQPGEAQDTRRKKGEKAGGAKGIWILVESYVNSSRPTLFNVRKHYIHFLLVLLSYGLQVRHFHFYSAFLCEGENFP